MLEELDASQTLPSVLIVTPSYNQGDYIRDTIESVLNQDYPNLKLFVVDGGSTDQTVSILKEYDSNPRFKWVSEPDNGQSDAINKGFNSGEGEILGWLCSDDYYFPGAIRHLVDTMLRTDAQCAFGDSISVTENKNILAYALHGGYHPSQFNIRIPLKQPTAIWTREVYERTGGVDLSLEQLMDRDIFWRMSKFGKFVHTPKFICAIREYDNAKTMRYFGTLHRDEIKVCSEKMGESAPIYFAQWLPGYESYPKPLKRIAQAVTKLYRLIVQSFYAPQLAIQREVLNLYWNLKYRSHKGQYIDHVFPSQVAMQNTLSKPLEAS